MAAIVGVKGTLYMVEPMPASLANAKSATCQTAAVFLMKEDMLHVNDMAGCAKRPTLFL